MAHKVHEGRNVKWFRELRQVKQESLAFDLGDDWNQKKVSLLEQKETIEPALLQQISKILDIPIEAFQKLDDEQVINIISNNSFDNCEQPASVFYNSTINPLEEIRKLHDEKIALYEKMIRAQDEMIARLEKLMEGK